MKIDRQNAGTIYAVTDDGIFKTADAGATWFTFDTFPTQFSVTANLAAAPVPEPSALALMGVLTGAFFRAIRGLYDRGLGEGDGILYMVLTPIGFNEAAATPHSSWRRASRSGCCVPSASSAAWSSSAS